MDPIRIYIDTNILNDIAPKECPWTETKWGKYLSELTKQKLIEVFASPTNCLEIAINSDLPQRQNMALALNTLVKGQRMAGTYEFYIAEEFLKIIQANWPEAVQLERLHYLSLNSAIQYIALIGQMAALQDFDCSKGFSDIIKPKLISQIIQSTILENPKPELERRLEMLRKKEYNKFDDFATFYDRPIEELKTLAQEIESKKYNINKSAVSWLKRNKNELVEGYMLDELFAVLKSVFRYGEDLLNTIKFNIIVDNWDKLHSNEVAENLHFRIKPLSKDIKQRFTEKTYNWDDNISILKLLAERFFKYLSITKAYSYNMINEMEKALNEGKVPTGGLVLDCQHILMPQLANFFLCRDKRLLSTAKYLQNNSSNGTALFRETASDLDEFKRKIEKEIKKRYH